MGVRTEIQQGRLAIVNFEHSKVMERQCTKQKRYSRERRLACEFSYGTFFHGVAPRGLIKGGSIAGDVHCRIVITSLRCCLQTIQKLVDHFWGDDPRSDRRKCLEVRALKWFPCRACDLLTKQGAQ